MCGIAISITLHRAGSAQPNNENKTKPETITNKADHDLESKLNKSLDLLAHRGPDARGIWISHDGTIAHTRLSINDLTPQGNQPLHSPSNQIHAVINGEIYDHDRLRSELAQSDGGYPFHSTSDSELVIALYRRHGSPKFLDHLRGEFALVLYDETTGDVIAARDRFGVKPLFWTVVDDKKLLLASEVKAFLPLGWEAEWDLGAVVDGGWANDHRTSFRGVTKVLPGCWMRVNRRDGEVVHERYWDMEYRDKRELETRTVEEMVLGVRERLTEAIRLRLRADVPVGIYLSGGIDSSLVAGIVTHLVRQQGIKLGNQDATGRICCFTVQFPPESGFDESEIAQRTADFLGVQILKKKMDEAAMAEYFADAVYHCEQPMIDLNAVGKFGLSTVPREQGFKVVLTGEGSDEHFSGYPGFLVDFLRENDHSLPEWPLSKDETLRRSLHQTMTAEMAERISKAGCSSDGLDDCKAYELVNGVGIPAYIARWQIHLGVFAPWVKQRWAGVDPRLVISNAMSPEVTAKMQEKWHSLHTSHYIWTKTMLANIFLSTLGDRTEMAHSIEARPPFLDHVLSDYVNSLPPSVKLGYVPVKQGTSNGDSWWQEPDTARKAFSEKWILREAGKPFITSELYERRKQPYLAPVRYPKDGPLHQKLREICTRDAVDKLGFLDYRAVEEAFERGFGENADVPSLRTLLYIGSWVTLGQRFGVKTASVNDLACESISI
ncbi:amidase chyE [Echria macrotheca]|uniref:Amidase chyE n=1 Tax=Echria macrotheca TaxID=438768 RepID=A0AAJ0BK09_9PEZI|nr:amidase chyE [Echria macrotheca]